MPVISPNRLRSLFGTPDECDFVAILSPQVDAVIEIEGHDAYKNVYRFRSRAANIPELIRDIERPAHVLCITSDGPFFSPAQRLLNNLKLAAVPLYSTTFTVDKLRDTLSLLYELDYGAQALRARGVVNELMVSEMLRFEFQVGSATLSLKRGRKIHVFDQSGAIDWNSQSVVPGGEVSLLTNAHSEYSVDDAFDLNGEILLLGYPVVHRGNSAILTDSGLAYESLFQGLSHMAGSRTLINVRGGTIESLRSLDKERSVERALSGLLAADERYRKIHEIGIGLNVCDKGFFSRDNFMPNEMRQGVHFGLGLTSYTEFHIDLVCVPVRVVSRSPEGERMVLEAA